MTRWLVQFGYDGQGFQGYARQPGARTVEGEILRGLRRLRLPVPTEGAGVEVASRTDRGVSARANALTLAASIPGTALLRALNGIAPDIFFRRASPVPPGFRVRKAIRRWYRYHETGPVRSLPRWRSAARALEGAIDVRSFGREIPSAAPQFRTVDSVTISPRRWGVAVDVRAPSFVWGMVRKIVAALRAVDREELSLESLREAVAGRRRLALPLAEPEPLVLWEVRYPIRWQLVRGSPHAHQRRYWAKQQQAVRARGPVVAALSPPEATGS